MRIQHLQQDNKGAFTFDAGGTVLAEMTYSLAGPKRMIIAHTEVDESLKGQNIGKKLLEMLVHYVREHDIKVIPLCPFATAMLKKTKEWQDVLEKPFT